MADDAKEHAKYVLKCYTDMRNYENELAWKKIGALIAVGALLITVIVAGIINSFHPTLMATILGIGFMFSFGLWYMIRRDNIQLQYLESKVSQWSIETMGEDVLDVPAFREKSLLSFRRNGREFFPFIFMVISIIFLTAALYKLSPEGFPDIGGAWVLTIAILILICLFVLGTELLRLFK